MTAQALEQSVLESKDKEQLLAIAKALGLKATTRTKKADIISQILDTTGSRPAASQDGSSDQLAEAPGAEASEAASAPAERTSQLQESANGASTKSATTASASRSASTSGGTADEEPPAEWELDADNDAAGGRSETPRNESGRPQQNRNNQGGGQQPDADGENRNKRRRRRRKSKGAQDGGQGDDRMQQATGSADNNRDNRDRDNRDRDNNHDSGRDSGRDNNGPTAEPVTVEGYLDMRDEGYGFLRVNHYLPSRDDAYIPVKFARQYGLRKGDHVSGLVRPANRNEKNPALLEVHTINGMDPDEAKKRPKFDDLTALFPDERLTLEDPADQKNMTARIIDLIAPIGKGQRGLIVSPPKAGKTTVMKYIAASIEKNNPDVTLMVLLLDERPEEVTDMRRHVKGEVIASTFDKPVEQHTQVAEMAIEKAKRMVEYGRDVVIIVDGITRLTRAYNLAAPASGKILSGGIDAGALYPPKKFFGAARNVEEGGSLTILATALVDTNSRMDDAVFEEFKGTGNMELRLDRRLAERRVFPAIDVDASSTRHEELLFDPKQLQMVWKLRKVLSGLAAEGGSAPGLELLVDRLRTFRTNAEFLTEIAKQPGM